MRRIKRRSLANHRQLPSGRKDTLICQPGDEMYNSPAYRSVLSSFEIGGTVTLLISVCNMLTRMLTGLVLPADNPDVISGSLQLYQQAYRTLEHYTRGCNYFAIRRRSIAR